MLTQPPVEELVEIAGNKYALCCVVAKRAKDLKKINPEIDSSSKKEITTATEELYTGKIVIDKE